MEWYKKTKNDTINVEKNIKSEIDEIKRLEELAMAEALGIPPSQIVKKELNQALSATLGSSSKEESNVNNSTIRSKDKSHKSSSHKRKHKKHKRSTSVDSHSSSSSVRHCKRQDRKYKDQDKYDRYKDNKYY